MQITTDQLGSSVGEAIQSYFKNFLSVWNLYTNLKSCFKNESYLVGYLFEFYPLIICVISWWGCVGRWWGGGGSRGNTIYRFSSAPDGPGCRSCRRSTVARRTP